MSVQLSNAFLNYVRSNQDRMIVWFSKQFFVALLTQGCKTIFYFIFGRIRFIGSSIVFKTYFWYHCERHSAFLEKERKNSSLADQAPLDRRDAEGDLGGGDAFLAVGAAGARVALMEEKNQYHFTQQKCTHLEKKGLFIKTLTIRIVQ